MALTSADLDQLRSALRDVSTLAQRDLLRTWRELDLTDARTVRDALMDVLPALTGGYKLAAATAAAEWYDMMRLESEVPGSFTALVPEDPPTTERIAALAGWGVGPLFGDADPATALSKIGGGVQRIVVDGGRDAIRFSTFADPQARGWQRVASPTACAFCRLLAGRGAVYSRAGVDFGAHDWCTCGVAPAWGGQALPVKPYTASLRYPDTPEGQARKAADQARLKRWMAEHDIP